MRIEKLLLMLTNSLSFKAKILFNSTEIDQAPFPTDNQLIFKLRNGRVEGVTDFFFTDFYFSRQQFSFQNLNLNKQYMAHNLGQSRYQLIKQMEAYSGKYFYRYFSDKFISLSCQRPCSSETERNRDFLLFIHAPVNLNK